MVELWHKDNRLSIHHLIRNPRSTHLLGRFVVMRFIGGKATGEVFQLSNAATLGKGSRE